MKFRLWGCLIVTTFAVSVMPVWDALGQINYTFAAGPNWTTLEVDFENLERPQYDAVVGFFAGVTGGIEIGPASIHAGATYVNAGAIFDGSEFLNRDNFDVGFITVPVDVRLYLPISLIASPYLLGGGELRYRLDLSDGEQGFGESLERQSIAAGIGAGVRLNVPGLGMSIAPEIRYAIDVTGLSSGEISVADEVFRIRNEFKADMLRFGLVVGL
jgi:hypothetical protein